MTVRMLNEKVLQKELFMIAPDVSIDDGEDSILISSEPGETDGIQDKLLKASYLCKAQIKTHTTKDLYCWSTYILFTLSRNSQAFEMALDSNAMISIKIITWSSTWLQWLKKKQTVETKQQIVSRSLVIDLN